MSHTLNLVCVPRCMSCVHGILRHIGSLEHEHGHVLGQGHVLDEVAVWYNMFQHGHPWNHACIYRNDILKKVLK